MRIALLVPVLDVKNLKQPLINYGKGGQPWRIAPNLAHCMFRSGALQV